MQFLRNKQVRAELIWNGLIVIIATGIAFQWGIPFAIFVFYVGTLLNIVHFYHTYKRYKLIQQLSFDIDKILHGDVAIVLNKYEEGELAILESEIQKMTTRLREQQQQLLNDKKYLADSIADISHQIRTPLTSINLLLSFLSEPDLSEEKRQKTIHEIYELLSRIEWLITALLKNTLKNKYVQAILRGLKPCVIGMVLATGIYMMIGNCMGTVNDIKVNIQAIIISIILLLFMLGYKHMSKKKLSPIVLIVISAMVGIVVYGV